VIKRLAKHTVLTAASTSPSPGIGLSSPASLRNQGYGETNMNTVKLILREALAAAVRPSGALLIVVGFILGVVIL